MGKNLLILFSLLFVSYQSAQSQCIQIESMLVDACDNQFSSPEGLNEMFRFRTTNFGININELEVFNGWPSQGVNTLPFNGFVQNNFTQSKTEELNSTIVSCGFLVEPPNGDIPPNSRVLAITSYDILVSLNSFANLSDTLFIIYHQHSGQAGGHFLNHSFGNPQTQEFRLRITGPNACEEIVSYERGNLVDINGNNSPQNGATVNFTDGGIPTYSNNGCQAPIQPFSAEWTNPGVLCSENEPIDLNGLITGTLGGTWSGTGVDGSIFTPANAIGISEITYTVEPANSCITQSESNTQTIQVLSSASADFNIPESICGDNQPIDLNDWLIGTPGGTWSGPGIIGGVFDVSGLNGITPIFYSVGTGVCAETNSQNIEIIQLPPLIIAGETEYCNFESPGSLETDPESGATVNWYQDNLLSELISTGQSYTPVANVSASYYVQQELNGCLSDTTSITINFFFVDMPTGDSLLSHCEGEDIPLASVEGEGSIFWYSDSMLQTEVGTGTTFQSNESNILLYVVSMIGECVSEALKIEIIELPILSAEILSPDGTSLCDFPELTLFSGGPNYNSWSTGEETQSIIVTEAGTYTLTREGECNTSTDEITVTGLPVFANFATDVDSGYVTLPVYITDLSINADECTWYLDSEELSFQAPGILQFPDSGTYLIELVCINNEGCSDTTSGIIKVLSDQLLINAPNVFTPNGDSFNELFQVEYNAVKTFNGRVFNRWGQLMFEWDDVKTGWDGNFNGNPAPEGTYFFVLNGSDIKDITFEEKGSITLIRD